MMARKATGETPTHNIRIPPELWQRVEDAARAEGDPRRGRSKIVIRALRQYFREPDSTARDRRSTDH